MKYYNFELAQRMINKLVQLDVLESASLGMHQDWFWTAETIWEEGKYKRDMPLTNEDFIRIESEYIEKRKAGMSILDPAREAYNNILVAGIAGSDWATPVIQIILKDGTEKTFNCFISDGEPEPGILEKIEKEMQITSGSLSRPVQERRDNLQIEEFKD